MKKQISHLQSQLGYATINGLQTLWRQRNSTSFNIAGIQASFSGRSTGLAYQTNCACTIISCNSVFHYTSQYETTPYKICSSRKNFSTFAASNDDSKAIGGSFHSNDLHATPLLDIQELSTQREGAARLLALPVGSFTTEAWFEAEELLPWWSVARTPESVHISFLLWERLLAEIKAQGNIAPTQDSIYDESTWTATSEAVFGNCVDSGMLERILNNWRVVSWNKDIEGYDPQQVLKRLEYYSKGSPFRIAGSSGTSEGPRFLVNEKSIYVVLEAALRRGLNGSDILKTTSNGGIIETTIPEFAELCLETCITHWRNGNNSCRPSTELFNLVIRAWVQGTNTTEQRAPYENNDDFGKTRDLIPYKVEALMSLMTELQVRYSNRTYNLAIQSWANTGTVKGAQNSQALLQRMFTEFNQGDAAVQPDPYAFTSVISAWAKSKSRDGWKKAENVLSQFRKLRSNKHLNIPRTQASKGRDVESSMINTLLQCYSNAATYATANRAQEAFDMMKQRLAQKRMYPNPISYLNLMRCWAVVGEPIRAESLLLELEKLQKSRQNDLFESYTESEMDYSLIDSQKSSNVSYDDIRTFLYTTVISAWAKSNKKDKIQRAEALLEILVSHEGSKISVVPYNAFLSVLKESDSEFHASKADSILQRLRERAATGESEVRPNYVTYSTVISTWALNGHFERAAEVLRDMYDDYVTGNVSAKPDLQCFNSVLAAFGRSNQESAPRKAQEFFDSMEKFANDGVLDVRPDVYSFTSVIASLASSKDDRVQAARKAEQYLEEMKRRYARGHINVKPNTMTFNAVMNAWARAGQPERAENLLKEMYEEYTKNGNEDIKPRTDSFNTLIKAWAFSKRPDATNRAEQVLNQMIELSNSGTISDVAPTTWTYTTMITCYGLSRKKGAPQRADELFEEMLKLCKNGTIRDVPPRKAYTLLKKAWSTSSEQNKAQRVAEISEMIAKKFGKGSS